MRTLEARVLSVLLLHSRPSRGELSGPSEESSTKLWQMRLSYQGPQTVYEIELREPLRSFASKKHTVGLNGSAEFEMLSQPAVAAGDTILIDAYEPGEKILG
jgi:hypothetical protein